MRVVTDEAALGVDRRAPLEVGALEQHDGHRSAAGVFALGVVGDGLGGVADFDLGSARKAAGPETRGVLHEGPLHRPDGMFGGDRYDAAVDFSAGLSREADAHGRPIGLVTLSLLSFFVRRNSPRR